MNFRVIWAPLAVLQLNTMWLAAPARAAMTAATLAISQSLAAARHAPGALLFDTVYEYNRPPLGVEFEVLDAQREVLILACWHTTTGRPPATGN